MVMLIDASCSTCTVMDNDFKMASLAGRHEMRVILNYDFMFFIPESIHYLIIVVIVSLVRYSLLVFLIHYAAGLPSNATFFY